MNMEKQHLFDRRENVVKVLKILFTSCVILFLLDFLFRVNLLDKHAEFGWEDWPGFYPVFGFVACVILVLISKYVLRPIVMRKEDYYDS
jgi:sterol desaturase/sphingolipid hydroxylase (fatty acid hydroxylase superfamily)